MLWKNLCRSFRVTSTARPYQRKIIYHPGWKTDTRTSSSEELRENNYDLSLAGGEGAGSVFSLRFAIGMNTMKCQHAKISKTNNTFIIQSLNIIEMHAKH